jgi:hypothetical protein
MSLNHENLAQLVQRNCHISDAKHAGSYTLCIYLLKMREYYRWETTQPFSNTLSTDDIGDWLTNREDLWEDLENEDYGPIETSSHSYDPFDSEGINQELLEQGLVYSGGIGHKAKPHFFLAKLERKEKLNGYQIIVSSDEYARDLTSPPAMSQGKTIYIRRESFKRMIWEKIETWQWNKPENAMARAMQCYDFTADIDGSLEAMTNNELESTVLHEIGEIKAGEQLNGWSDMMSELTFTQAEIMARAVRDHLADAISTLPALLQQQNEASIHFYFANLTNMRKHIYPSLESAYQQWIKSHNISELEKAINKSETHWQNIASQMLSLHNTHQGQCSSHIESLVNNNQL